MGRVRGFVGGIIGGIREKFWDYVLYSSLVLYSFLLFVFFMRGMPPTNKIMLLLGFVFVFLAITASSLRKYSLMILALLALAFSIYLYSYSLQYPTDYLTDIESGFNFQASDNVEFLTRESELIFDNEKTVLKDYLTFRVFKDVNETAVLSLSPPKSTETYKIHVVHGEKKYVLQPIRNEHVKDNTFPELDKLEVPLKAQGFYTMVTVYELPKMDPSSRVTLWGAHNHLQINFDNIHSAIYFSDMLYECIDPCIVVYSANITNEPPYVWKTDILEEGANEKPTASYYLSGENVDRIVYAVRTSRKWAIAIRNLMLSIIAGLIVALTLIGIQNNSNSYK